MRARPHWWLAVAQSMAVLPLVRLLLWTRGYVRTLSRLAAIAPDPRGGGDPADVPARVAEIASAVTLVARLAPFRSRCLARSITIWWLCRRSGHDVEVLVGVPPHAEIDLPERIEPVGAQHLEQHPDLHAVSGHERQSQQRPADERALAGQRLDETEEARLDPAQQRPRHQLGDPPATPTRRRPVVEALDHDE
jgi:hypothetical protein